MNINRGLQTSTAVIQCALLAALLYAANSAAANPYSLLELYEIAQENDASFRAEENKYSALLLNPKIARSELLPQLGISADNTRIVRLKTRGSVFGSSSSSEHSYNVNSWSLNLTQTLFDKEKIVRFRQSKSEAEQAALIFEAAHQDLILRLATAYFSILTAESHLAFARAEKDAVAKQLQQAQTQFEVGLSPITDAKEAQAAYDLAIADEIDADNNLQNSYHQLELITNRPIKQLLPLRDNIPIVAPTPDDIEAWVDKATANNVDVLAQKIAVNIAREEIAAQRSDHYPSLDIFAQHSDSNVRGGPAPNERWDTQIGIRMNMLLFAGGRTYYKSQQAVHRHRETLQLLAETQREVRKSARASYLNVIASISRITALAHAVESAQAAVDSNRAGFNVGTRTSAEVLIVLKDLFRAQRDYIEARHNYMLEILRLQQAAGKLTQADVAQISSWLSAKTP